MFFQKITNSQIHKFDMENKDFKELIMVLYKDFRKYIKLQLDYYKLDAVETIVVFITKVFSFAIIWAVIPVAAFFALIGLSLFLGDLLGANYWGFFIVTGVVALFGLILYLLRKPIFTNPIINALVTAVFSNKKLKRKNEKKKKISEYK